jgi:hypothetical protein
MTNPSSTSEYGRGYRLVARTVLTTAAAAAFIGMASVSASAAPGDTDTASVIANVDVNSTINLAIDQGNFDLNLLPSSNVDKTGAVTGRVTTNNAAGYSVGVVAQAATLQGRPGNTDSIPIAALEVHNAAGVYTSLSSNPANPVITTTKNSRSAIGTNGGPDGDTFSDDYQVTVGDINSDVYSVTLNYTATALA